MFRLYGPMKWIVYPAGGEVYAARSDLALILSLAAEKPETTVEEALILRNVRDMVLRIGA